MSNQAEPTPDAKFYGAEVRTAATARYGRISARVTAVQQPGVVSSLFTFRPDWKPGEDWDEQDLEFAGSFAGRVQSNLRIRRPADNLNEMNAEEKHALSDAVGPYVLSMDWLPHEATWSLNGTVIRRKLNLHAYPAAELDGRLNLWSAAKEKWAGRFDGNVPVCAFVDWVEFSRFDPSSGTFDLLWKDDFDTFEASRWHTATWWNRDSSSRFHPNNVEVRDSWLILALTQEPGVPKDVRLPAR